MNEFKQYLRFKINNFNSVEIISTLTVLILITINFLIFHDNIFAILAGVFGFLYTIYAGKGKVICYLFGFLGSSCYTYLLFKNNLYGNFLLYLCYYLPMYIIGLINWNKHINETTNEVIKIRLSVKKRLILLSLGVISCIILAKILFYTDDSNFYIDSITTVFSVLGMYLTIKRCIEQWFCWMIVNLFSVILWVNLISQGEKAITTALMWGIYLFLAFYFYNRWSQNLDS